MATVLNLFGHDMWEALKEPPTQAIPEGKPLIQNCCYGCELRNLCDDDSCGRQLFSPEPPFDGTRFPNLGVYVEFLKKYGWA